MPYLGKCDTYTCVHRVVVVIQWLTCVWPFVTPWIIARQAPLSSTISRSLLRFMTIELVMPSNQLILCCPLLLLPSIFPSIRVFSNSQLFALGSQSVGASTSIFPMSIQDWFPLGLTGLNSLQSKGLLSRVFSSTAVRGHQFFCTQPSLWSNSYICTSSFILGILQARILEWVAMPFSRGSSQPGDQTCLSTLAGGLFTTNTTWKALICLHWVPVAAASELLVGAYGL